MVTLVRRAAHCQLAGVNVGLFEVLRAREQLPSLSNRSADYPKVREARGLAEEMKGYTPYASVQLAIAGEFVAQGMAWSRGCEVAIPFMRFTQGEDWRRICVSGLAIARNAKPKEEILFGECDRVGTRNTVVFGTFAEIAAEHRAPLRCTLVNVSRVVAEVRRRAMRHGIDVGDLFDPTDD